MMCVYQKDVNVSIAIEIYKRLLDSKMFNKIYLLLIITAIHFPLQVHPILNVI